MTREQVMRIDELRIDGSGAGSIAKTMELPLNTVKSYLRRHPLLSDNTNLCRCCGKPVKQTQHKREKKFCSDSCRMKWWNAHQDQVRHWAVYDYTCPGCGIVFSAYGNAHRKYCSHACYINHRYGGAQV